MGNTSGSWAHRTIPIRDVQIKCLHYPQVRLVDHLMQTSNIDTAVDIGSTILTSFTWNPIGSSDKLIWDTCADGNTLNQGSCTLMCRNYFLSYTGTDGTLI